MDNETKQIIITTSTEEQKIIAGNMLCIHEWSQTSRVENSRRLIESACIKL